MKRLAMLTVMAAHAIGAGAALAQEPTNPAAATLTSHIMLAPEDLDWQDCSAALPLAPSAPFWRAT